MGACCGGTDIYPEIDEAGSVSEIANFLRNKAKDCNIESKEIEEYLKDKSKIPKKVDVAYQSPENLKNRANYLPKFSSTMNEVSDILENHSELNLESVKTIVHKLYDYYFLSGDDSEKHKQIPSMLRALIK